MKLNKTTLNMKAPSSYQDLISYQDAEYNVPYVTAALSADYFADEPVRNFTIGLYILYVLTKT